MKTKKIYVTITMVIFMMIAVATSFAQSVSISTKAVFYGESVEVTWHGFRDPVNVILYRGNHLIAYASANVAGGGSQKLVMTNEAIGTGYKLSPGIDYYVKVELRSNTSVSRSTLNFSVSIPSLKVEPASAKYGETVKLTWSGFASNINLLFMDNGREITHARIDAPVSGSQQITLTDDAVNKPGYQLTSGNNYTIKAQLRSAPEKYYSSNAFSISRTFDFNIAPVGSVSLGNAASQGQILIYANSEWTASKNQSWIAFTSSTTGKGNGVVNWQVNENTSPGIRTGAITITAAGNSKKLSIEQAGKSITLSVSPSDLVLESSGGSQSISVFSNAGWNTSVNVPWIKILSGGNGWYNGQVAFYVDENTSSDSRSGLIEVSTPYYPQKQSVAIHQNGIKTVEKMVSFNPDGVSSIIWPYAQSTYANPAGWRLTQGKNSKISDSWHYISDYYAQDWGYYECPDSTFFAPFTGIVIYTGLVSGYGNHIVIQSLERPDFAFRVAHLHEINVINGQKVNAGQKIGKVGSTGNSTGFHAHAVLYKNIDQEYSKGVSGVDHLKTGRSLGIAQQGGPNTFAADFIFDATFETAIGGGGFPITPDMYGFTLSGRFFLNQIVLEGFRFGKILVGFYNVTTSLWQESEMKFSESQYTFESGDNYTGVREYLFILVSDGRKMYLPEDIHNRIHQKSDVISNGIGGMNFRTTPIDSKSDIEDEKAMILRNHYGFTYNGKFFIHKSIPNVFWATAVQVGYWNYSLGQWQWQKMSLENDFWVCETWDNWHDYRDLIYLIESPNGQQWLPAGNKDRINIADIRSNGHGGWNFFCKPQDFGTESETTIPELALIGSESYGFSTEGLFWLSSVVVEIFNSIEKVEVGYWSYREQKWLVKTMYLADKRYWFSSEDYHSGYRDYVFILHNKGEIIYLPESILDRIIQKQDVRSNNQGGSSFYTLPKEPPVDTKSAMIITTSIDVSSQFAAEFAIFPNPVEDKINFRLVNLYEKLAYKIFDIHGRCVQQDFNYTANQISINLKPGLYFLEVVTEDKKFVEKFVVR